MRSLTKRSPAQRDRLPCAAFLLSGKHHQEASTMPSGDTRGLNVHSSTSKDEQRVAEEAFSDGNYNPVNASFSAVARDEEKFPRDYPTPSESLVRVMRRSRTKSATLNARF